jgi:hypothetical protein
VAWLVTFFFLEEVNGYFSHQLYHVR